MVLSSVAKISVPFDTLPRKRPGRIDRSGVRPGEPDRAVDVDADDVLEVDTRALLEAGEPENEALRAMLEEKLDAELLRGRRVAILVTDGVEEVELTFVRRITLDRGAEVDLVSPAKPAFPAKFGVKVHPPDDGDLELDEREAVRCLSIVCSGRHGQTSTMRPTLAALCHGPQVLISAGLAKGVA